MPGPVTSIRRTLLLGLSFACLLLLAQTLRAQAPGVHVEYHQDYFLYEPAEGSDFSGDTMPLVVYLHGAPWFIEPFLYDSMLREVAAAGCVVVMPVYKETDVDKPEFLPWNWYAYALKQTQQALSDVVSGRTGAWRPRYCNLALVGHSLGGTYALKMADEATDTSLPADQRLPASPKTIVLHDAAGYNALLFVSRQPYDPNWINDLDGIRDDATLVIVAAASSVIADRDREKPDYNATAIWSRAWHLSDPLQSKRAYIALGGHFDVYGIGAYDVYAEATVNALKPLTIDGEFVETLPNNRIDWWMDSLYR